MFEILKEYQIENEELVAKYRHPSVQWYRKSHIAKMDGAVFNQAKPPKDWNERIAMTKSQFANNSVKFGESMKTLGGHIKSGAVKAGTGIKSGV